MNKIKRAFFLTGLSLLSFVVPMLAGTGYSIETIPDVRLADRSDHVSNPDGIITPADAAQINGILNLLEDSLGIEVAVVAINSIGDNDARSFATDLFKHWGIGKRGKDDGLLIQLVTEPSQRSVVFETGYGLEGVLPDAICYRLQQRYMIADLKAAAYSAGMLKGVAAVAQYLMASDYERTEMTGNAASPGNDDFYVWIFILAAVGAISLFSMLAYYLKHKPRTCPSCGNKTFVYVGQHTLHQATHHSGGMVEEIYRCKSCGHTEKKQLPTDRLRSGGGGGPIFMGGGGFGGGGFGGGGGGSWGGGRSGGGGSISRF